MRSHRDPTRIDDMETWLLHDRGHHLMVDTWLDEGRNHARLSVDGEEVASGEGSALDTVKLADHDRRVRVDLLWKGRARAVELIDHGDGASPSDGDGFRVGRFGAVRVPFEPPPGTRAARVHAWRETHPRWWAARHVAIEVVAIAAASIGVGAVISALFGSLLPRVDLGWLPDIEPPSWLRYLDPFSWLGRILPDVDWFGWVPDVDLPELGWLKYVVVLGIAVAAGVSELRKRRQREQREGGPLK